MSEAASLPTVTVILALHRPSVQLARRQVDSLAGQTGVDLSCVAVLDGSETADDPELRQILAQPRIEIVVHREAQGVRAAFAAGLSRGLASAKDGECFFAYCDQDDVWHADKLARCCALAKATGASLVHCDARVMSEKGDVIAPSLHRYEKRSEAANLLEALLLNCVTGMTTLFPLRTAKLALVLMQSFDGEMLHDHITAVAAASLGKVVFLDAALVDYVQHPDNQLGARVYRPYWGPRAIGLSHVSAYRQTSLAIYLERRKLALLLAGEGQLPQHLAVLFKAGRTPGKVVVFVWYYIATLLLLLKWQYRRAVLCGRMMDAAVWLT